MSVRSRKVYRSDPMYPEDDGQPIADNTLQFRWIVNIKQAVDHLFRDRPDVFVAGNLLWYPVEGDPRTRVAPDIMIAFGAGIGDRGSYRQWDEDGIAPQVVFEVLSPGNTPAEMSAKLEFYRRHGVEEYYIFDPDRIRLSGWLRDGDRLVPVDSMVDWISPLLQIRFEIRDRDLILYGPDGERFKAYAEIQQENEELQEQVGEQRERAERLAARLRELGIDPDS